MSVDRVEREHEAEEQDRVHSIGGGEARVMHETAVQKPGGAIDDLGQQVALRDALDLDRSR